MLGRCVAGRREHHDPQVRFGRAGGMAPGRHLRGHLEKMLDGPGWFDADDLQRPPEASAMRGGEEETTTERTELFGDRSPENEAGVPDGDHRLGGGNKMAVDPRHHSRARATFGSADSQGIHRCRAFTADGCRTPGSTRHAEWRIGDLNP